MSDQPQYVDGLYPKPKHPKARDFVIGKLSINVAQFREWLKNYLRDNPDAEWINIDMTTRKGDPTKGSAKLDTWKPERGQQALAAPKSEPYYDSDDTIPF